jgi:hypothetical protein
LQLDLTGTLNHFAQEVRMFSNEGFFRLLSVAILGVLFVSVTAMAEKEKKALPQNLFNSVQSIEEADQINSDQLQAGNFTTVGNRVEVVTPVMDKK